MVCRRALDNCFRLTYFLQVYKYDKNNIPKQLSGIMLAYPALLGHHYMKIFLRAKVLLESQPCLNQD